MGDDSGNGWWMTQEMGDFPILYHRPHQAGFIGFVELTRHQE